MLYYDVCVSCMYCHVWFGANGNVLPNCLNKLNLSLITNRFDVLSDTDEPITDAEDESDTALRAHTHMTRPSDVTNAHDVGSHLLDALLCAPKCDRGGTSEQDHVHAYAPDLSFVTEEKHTNINGQSDYTEYQTREVGRRADKLE